MKKTTKIIALCLVAMMLVLSFVSCSDDADPLVGTWIEVKKSGAEGEKLVLKADGTGTLSEDGMSVSIKWSAEGNKFSITATIFGMTETEEQTYELSNGQLTFTDEDGDKSVYRKG